MSIERANRVLGNVIRNLVEQEEGQSFWITDKGLVPVGTKQILIQPKTFYYMGASSSPSRVLVMDADDKKITYRNYPYKHDAFIERKAGQDLIHQGVMTFLKSGYTKYPWGKHEAEGFRKLLNGKKIQQVDPTDWVRISVDVLPGKGYEGRDMWREAETYGNVAGSDAGEGVLGFQSSKNSPPVKYEIEMFRGDLDRLKKDKRFRVGEVKEI